MDLSARPSLSFPPPRGEGTAAWEQSDLAKVGEDSPRRAGLTARRLSPPFIAIPPTTRMVQRARLCAASRKPIAVPVDPTPPLQAAAPLPHLRKLAFAFGAIATAALLFLVQKLVAGL